MNVAVLGLGFMGATHLKAWGKVPDARVVAVASSSARKLTGDLTGAEGNLGLETQPVDLSSMRKYGAWQDALADSGVDAVDICLPSNLHASVAIAALAAGKHVLVEKPVALNGADAEAVLDASKRYERALMAGHVLRFMGGYKPLREAENVTRAVFRRECGTPGWVDLSTTGGPVLDLLIHDIDMCISLWGMPLKVDANTLKYETFTAVIEGGWHADPAYPFSASYEVATPSGTLRWQSGESGEDPFAEELKAFTRYVNEGGAHPCPPEESVNAVVIAEKMMEARCRQSA